MENKIGRNRKSPKNEEEYVKSYLEMNPKAKNSDTLDVSAVVLKDGTKGHGLLPQEINRSHDRENHIVKDFIPDSELRKK